MMLSRRPKLVLEREFADALLVPVVVDQVKEGALFSIRRVIPSTAALARRLVRLPLQVLPRRLVLPGPGRPTFHGEGEPESSW